MAPPIPKEALDYLKKKKLKPSFSYKDVWKEEHIRAFTVAKAMDIDLLSDIKNSLVNAMEEGITYREWAKNMTQNMQDKGWWGKKAVVDPVTGKTIEAQLGCPRRLKTIFDVNMGQAYQKGVWDRGSQSAGHPYVLYRVGPSANHRKQHLEWDGLVLPKDDPFWETHNPRNGYGCKCTTRFLSEAKLRQLQKKGLPDPQSMKDGKPTRQIPIKTARPKLEKQTYLNKRTGEVHEGYKGVDPGFEYNVGKSYPEAAGKVFRSKLPKLKEITPGPQPKGIPVSNALEVKTRKHAPAVQHALNLINKVHGDGRLPKILVVSSTAKGFMGKYEWTLKGGKIRMANTPNKELTATHEIGHFLDHKGLPGKGLTSENPEERALRSLLKTVDASPEIQQLRNLPLDKNRHRDYLLEKSEIFARAYSQYIAVKSGDKKMLGQVDDVILKSKSEYDRLSQWEPESFIPIQQEMDILFKEMGWL